MRRLEMLEVGIEIDFVMFLTLVGLIICGLGSSLEMWHQCRIIKKTNLFWNDLQYLLVF